MLFAKTVTATGADGNRGTMAVHDACGHETSGNHLIAPAFSFNEWSHGVLLSAVMKVVVAPRRSAPKRPCSGQEREERRNRIREMLPPGKRM
jgi:hypothetical protein